MLKKFFPFFSEMLGKHSNKIPLLLENAQGGPILLSFLSSETG